jgi:hypothetical protein
MAVDTTGALASSDAGGRRFTPAAFFLSGRRHVPLVEPIYERQKSNYHKNDSY